MDKRHGVGYQRKRDTGRKEIRKRVIEKIASHGSKVLKEPMRSFLCNVLGEFLLTNEMRSKFEFLDTAVINAGVYVCVYMCVYVCVPIIYINM